MLAIAESSTQVPETKGLTLEQVDLMLEQSTPRTSAKWRPTTTVTAERDVSEKTGHDGLQVA